MMPNTPQTFTDAQRMDFVLANSDKIVSHPGKAQSRDRIDEAIRIAQGKHSGFGFVLPESCKPSMCDATVPGVRFTHGLTPVRCTQALGHATAHGYTVEAGDILVWDNPTSAESPALQCGHDMLTASTGPVCVFCLRLKGHPGNHSNGPWTWPNKPPLCCNLSPDGRHSCEKPSGHVGWHACRFEALLTTTVLEWDENSMKTSHT